MDRWEPMEEFLGPVLELAIDFGVPVFMHAHGLNLVGSFIGKYASAQLVVYHMGGFDGLWLARNHDNIWLGLSWCDAYKIATAEAAVGACRLIYGTDAPIRLVKNPVIDSQGGSYRTYPEMLLKAIEKAGIDSEKMESICSRNARRLLSMAKKSIL